MLNTVLYFSCNICHLISPCRSCFNNYYIIMFDSSPIIPMLVLLLGIVFIFLIVLAMKNRFSLLKFYLTMVSLVGVIGLAVGYGVALYNGIQSALISNEEYMAGQGRMYSLDQCKQPQYSAVAKADETPVAPTAEEITACEEKTTANLLAQRSYDTKQTVIGGITWGTLALILFLIHYPMLVKKSKEEATD